MAYYSYKITRDYGFAPNPFFGYCTLACCKPRIRGKACIGDWIIGTGAKENNLLYYIIYIMRITEKMTFEAYSEDIRFQSKKPVLNGSLKQIYGDNIYYKDGEIWHQRDSHHSHHNGVLNQANLKQDTTHNSVLVSNDYIYLGGEPYKTPKKYVKILPNSRQRDFIKIKDENLAEEVISLIQKTYSPGLNGDPLNWIEYSQFTLDL